MANLSFLTSTYARNIYLYGTRTFQTIIPSYVEDVKSYAASTFTKDQIDAALNNKWITEQEHQGTIKLIPTS